MKITRRKLRQIIKEELARKLDESSSAADILAQIDADRAAAKEASGGLELYGNCGMMAIAVVREAQRRGAQDARIIMVHDAHDVGEDVFTGDYDIGHVVALINSRYFDDRGEISEDQITVIDGEDLLDPHMSEVFTVETFTLEPAIESAIERNTASDRCPSDFRERASSIVDQAMGGAELTAGEADELESLVADAVADALDIDIG